MNAHLDTSFLVSGVLRRIQFHHRPLMPSHIRDRLRTRHVFHPKRCVRISRQYFEML